MYAFDGIYHWRDDCGYLNEQDREWVRWAFGPAPATREEAAKLADAIDVADAADGEQRPRGPRTVRAEGAK